MSLRSQQILINNPCLYKLKDFDKGITDPAAPPTSQMVRVKKLIPKLDEKGNIVYKTVSIPVKKGCGCKGKPQTTEMKEQKVPEMVETEIETTVQTQATIDKVIGIDTSSSYVICKLYGTIKASMCENCKTYRQK